MSELLERHTHGLLGGKGSGKTTFLLMKAVESISDKQKVVLIDCGGVINQEKVDGCGVENHINLMVLKKKGLEAMLAGKTAYRTLLNHLTENRKKVTVLRLELTALESRDFFNAVSPILLKLRNIVLLVDEAEEVLPQQGRETYSSELERLIRIGRNYNIVVFLATHRAQDLNKRVLALADVYYFGKITHYLDARICAEITGIDSTKARLNFRNSIKNLKVGNFYEVFGSDVSLLKYNLENKKLERIFGRPTQWKNIIDEGGKING